MAAGVEVDADILAAGGRLGNQTSVAVAAAAAAARALHYYLHREKKKADPARMANRIC